MRLRLLAILLLALGCSKREAPAPVGPAPGEWRTITIGSAKCSLSAPGVFQQTVQDVPTALGKISMNVYVYEVPGGQKAFAVCAADYPPGLDYGDEKVAQDILKGVVGGVARGRKAQIVKQSPIKLGEHHGQEFVMDVDGGNRALCRVYLRGNRLYQLLTEWSPAREDGTAEAERFLNSFRLVD